MTAQIIPFPAERIRLSRVAELILRDMRSRSAGYGDAVRHSIIDGIRCSGGSRRQVVLARRELQERGLAIVVAPGTAGSAALWHLCGGSYALMPDGAA